IARVSAATAPSASSTPITKTPMTNASPSSAAATTSDSDWTSGLPRFMRFRAIGAAYAALRQGLGDGLDGQIPCGASGPLLRLDARDGLRAAGRRGRQRLLAERVAAHDTVHELREFVVAARGVAHDRAHLRHVVVRELAADRVHHELLGDRLRELVGPR